MVSALMSGWMAVSCPPWSSCMMPGWHTHKKRAGRIATEPTHPGNHLLRNSSCGRQHLLFTAPYGTVCTPTTVTANMLLTVNCSLFVQSHSDCEKPLQFAHVLWHLVIIVWLYHYILILCTCNMAALTKYGNLTRHQKESLLKIPSRHIKT